MGRRQGNQWLREPHRGTEPHQNPLFLANVTMPRRQTTPDPLVTQLPAPRVLTIVVVHDKRASRHANRQKSEWCQFRSGSNEKLEQYRGGAAGMPSMTNRIHQEQIGVFCGADEGWHNLYTSVEVANGSGFKRPIM